MCLVFFGVSAAFGGSTFAIQLLGRRGLTLNNGIFTPPWTLPLILLSAAGCYAILSLVFRRMGGHGLQRELVPAILALEEGGWHLPPWWTRATPSPTR